LGTRQANRGQGREELLELYKLALEDYRFQVQLNWGRSQYFLVLNLTLYGIATGIVQFAGGEFSILVAGIYLLGVFFCAFSVAALLVQRKYYVSAREQKKRFEEELGLGERSITPVERPDEKIRQLATFKAFVNVMFVALATLNLFSAIFVVVQSP
jgi:hypothetical protein